LQATQLPVASHVVPPLSEHIVPFGAGVASHLLLVQTPTMHFDACGVQSDSLLQATQSPAVSQTLPPLSVHDVPEAAFVVPHTFAVQFATLHAVVGVGQSPILLHATQLPWPSHVVPLLSVHAVPSAAFDVPHKLPVHVSTRHLVVCAGQSVAEVHFSVQLPAPSHVLPPLSLHVVPSGAN
jgi:hypothetical protein